MVTNYKNNLEVAVGTSTKENARNAGKEVAENTLKQMKSKPSFFLLFSTIDYDDNGGFQELLNGVWEVLPEGIPLIGSTVFGFLNSQGCYARGVTAMAISYPNMDVTIGYGKNTKRSPKKATKQCVKMIKDGLKDRYKNKFLLSIISGFKLPRIPEKNEVAIVKSKILSSLTMPMLKFSQKVFQKGFGNEESILEKLTKELPDINLLHLSSVDNLIAKNFQFLNKKIFTNSMICLVFETDVDFNINFTIGLEKTDVEFKVSKTSKDGLITKKINDKPAYPEFLRLMGWSEESLENKAIDKFIRFPIAFYKNNRIIVRVAGMILRDSLGFFKKYENENEFVVNMSPQKIVESFNELLTLDKPNFGFIISCNSNQMLLGYKIFEVQDKLKKYFQDKSFLLVFGFGEGMYKPNDGLYYLNEATVSAIFKVN